MPTSSYQQIPTILDIIMAIKPNKILDIGIGFGKYGFLLREYLELWDGRDVYNDFRRQIDGIEIFPDYITSMHKYLYNTIYIGDAIEVSSRLSCVYDIVLLIDCLEHFNREGGLLLLSKLKDKTKNILISVPNNMSQQKTSFKNEHETHRFQWRKEDFIGYKDHFFINTDRSLTVLLGNDVEIIEKYYRNQKIRKIKSIIKSIIKLGKGL
jgi:hypothetical protein